jgi:phospholipid/cholesterol/gamma-HCH transport system substrate-binding protein
VAQLTSKGLLGDMIIDVTVGSADEPPLGDGASLRSQEREGMTEVLTSMKQAIDEVRTLSGVVGKRLDAVFTDQLAHDLSRIAHAAAGVAEQVERGDGLAHEVIYDPRLSRDARHLLADGRGVAGDALRAVDHLDELLSAVKTGNGTLHGLVYRDDAAGLFDELQKTARELGQVTDQLRNGKGTLHTLIYDQDAAGLLADLSAASRTLRQLGDEVQQGKGTVGALLKDPSVYEDLKAIVGSVQRSRILRSLIRYEIKHAK